MVFVVLSLEPRFTAHTTLAEVRERFLPFTIPFLRIPFSNCCDCSHLGAASVASRSKDGHGSRFSLVRKGLQEA